jgi:hypothetical protein
MTGIVDFRTSLLDKTGAPIDGANPLPVTSGGGGGGNSAAGPTGAAVPTDADYIGFNSGGNLVGVSSSNPLPVSVGNFPATQPVSGSVSVSNFPATQNVNIVGGPSGNAAASATGAAVPASADYIGFNSGGNLVGVSSANPLPVDIGAVGVLEVSDSTAELLLTRMLSYLNAPMGYDKSLQRQRGTVLVESGTVTTVTAVTSLNNIDTYNARMTVLDTNRTAWAQCVRARIT